MNRKEKFRFVKMIRHDDISTAFEGLSRPECVICTASAGIFVSHDPVGVLHLRPDGGRTLYGRHQTIESGQFTPNGIALSSDGRLMIANTRIEGGVWHVDRSDDCRPFLMEVDGKHLHAANFVLADAQDRLWISVPARSRGRRPTTIGSRMAILSYGIGAEPESSLMD
jgi:sugar lactone lactonase YvrE